MFKKPLSNKSVGKASVKSSKGGKKTAPPKPVKKGK